MQVRQCKGVSKHDLQACLRRSNFKWITLWNACSYCCLVPLNSYIKEMFYTVERKNCMILFNSNLTLKTPYFQGASVACFVQAVSSSSNTTYFKRCGLNIFLELKWNKLQSKFQVERTQNQKIKIMLICSSKFT